MKRILLAVLTSAFFVGMFAGMAIAAEECPSGNLNLLYGKKQLSKDWEPLDFQDEFGGIIDMRGPGWPVHLEVSYLVAVREGRVDELLSDGVEETVQNVEREGRTEEISAGVKKIWEMDNDWNFFVSGGASWIRGELEIVNVQNFDDSKLGWYASAGAYYTLIKFINLGVLARYSNTKVSLGGRDLDAGGFHYAALAGLHF